MDKTIDFPKKKELIEEMRKNHIIFAALFGSRAKETAKEDSDYDLLVEFDPAVPIPLSRFMKVEENIKQVLDSPVDIVTINGLGRKSFKQEVLSTMKVFYDRREG